MQEGYMPAGELASYFPLCGGKIKILNVPRITNTNQ